MSDNSQVGKRKGERKKKKKTTTTTQKQMTDLNSNMSVITLNA